MYIFMYYIFPLKKNVNQIKIADLFVMNFLRKTKIQILIGKSSHFYTPAIACSFHTKERWFLLNYD